MFFYIVDLQKKSLEVPLLKFQLRQVMLKFQLHQVSGTLVLAQMMKFQLSLAGTQSSGVGSSAKELESRLCFDPCLEGLYIFLTDYRLQCEDFIYVYAYYF